MDLVEVDVRRVQARERALDGVKDSRAREAGLVEVLLALVDGRKVRVGEEVAVGALADEAPAFGGDDDFFARNLVL